MRPRRCRRRIRVAPRTTAETGLVGGGNRIRTSGPSLIDDAFDTAPFRLYGTSRSTGKTGSFLRERPAVRIRFPPAGSHTKLDHRDPRMTATLLSRLPIASRCRRKRDSNPRSRPPLFLPEPVHPGAAYRRVGALPLPTWPETRIGVWPARFYHPLGRL